MQLISTKKLTLAHGKATSATSKKSPSTTSVLPQKPKPKNQTVHRSEPNILKLIKQSQLLDQARSKFNWVENCRCGHQQSNMTKLKVVQQELEALL